MAKYFFLDEKIVYQSLYDAPLTFSSFSSRKIFVFRQASARVYCLKILVEKMISPVLIQIVHSNGKMLFFQPKDCLSKFLWRAAHVKLFFFKEKFVFYSHASASLSFEAFGRPCRKNEISAYI